MAVEWQRVCSDIVGANTNLDGDGGIERRREVGLVVAGHQDEPKHCRLGGIPAWVVPRSVINQHQSDLKSRLYSPCCDRRSKRNHAHHAPCCPVVCRRRFEGKVGKVRRPLLGSVSRGADQLAAGGVDSARREATDSTNGGNALSHSAVQDHKRQVLSGFISQCSPSAHVGGENHLLQHSRRFAVISKILILGIL